MAAPASAAVFLLQGYLADPRTVDAVYQGLMQRAWAQPLRCGADCASRESGSPQQQLSSRLTILQRKQGTYKTHSSSCSLA